MSLLEYAKGYVKNGISVVPTNHKTKHPIVPEWAIYRERLATSSELRKWFSDDSVQSLAAVCGRVSGGLIVIDFDVPSYYSEWVEETAGLADGLPVQRTGGGGYQVFLRCPEPLPSQKLAWHPNPAAFRGRETAIETRGEGGCATLPPSIHPSGRRYRWFGWPNTIPVLPQSQASVLLDVARSLDRAPVPQVDDSGEQSGFDF